MLKIMLTNICNLNCTYCYEKEKKCKNLSLEDGKRAIDFYLSKYIDLDKDISILYHGGEPLLQFELMKNLSEYTKDKAKKLNKKCKFSFTTNGTLLNEDMASYLYENNFNISLSLDGMKDVHDSNRKFLNSEGSFESAMKGLRILKRIYGKKNITIRLTVTPKTIDSLSNNVNWLVENGYRHLNISLDFFDDWGRYLKNIKQQINIVKNIYLKCIEEEEITLDIFDGNFTNYLLKREPKFCNAGIGSITVDTDGKIYPCVYAIDKKLHIGNIDQGVDMNKYKQVIEENLDKDNLKISYCKDCNIKYFCHARKCSFMNLISEGYLNRPSIQLCNYEKIMYTIVGEVIHQLYLKENHKIIKLINTLKSNKNLSLNEKYITA